MKTKKVKDRKKRAIKGIVKFEDYRNCLGTTQLESKVNHFEENNFE